MTGTSPSKIVTPCTSFVPPLKSTIASPEMTIEHLAQISTLTCLFKSRPDQDDLTCKSCQWWHWINDDNDDTEPGWLAVRVLPTPSCHHCRPGLAVVGVICYQRMLSPSSHQCQFIIAVLIVAGVADITLSHWLILKLASKAFTWISCQQAAALLLTKKMFSENLKMISKVLCTVVSYPTRWSLLFIFWFLYGSSKQQRNIVQLCTIFISSFLDIFPGEYESLHGP